MKIDVDEIDYITETTLTIRGSRRRTTLPVKISEKFGIKNGDMLRWVLMKDGTIIIKPVKKENVE